MRSAPLILLALLGACAGPARAEQIPRLSPRDAHERVETSRAILVCAYEKRKCVGTHLAGAITLEELENRLADLPRDQELIFFCG